MMRYAQRPALLGQRWIAFEGDHLMVEDVKASDLMTRFWGHVDWNSLDGLDAGPVFAYSKAAMLSALDAYTRAFQGRQAKVHFAVKANSNLAIIKLFAQAGCGFDIVSAGELRRVLAAGAKAQDVIFSGVGKTRAEMAFALQMGVGCFNVESEAELDVLNDVASKLGQVAAISVRVNPDVDPKTHPYISTGLKGNKFGIAADRVITTYLRAASLPALKIMGIDCHIGSQITQVAPYLEAVDRMLDFVDQLKTHGITLSHIDFGGGLGVQYQDDVPPAADTLWTQLLAKIDARRLSDHAVWIEPGRSLVANAGVCLTQVLYLKPGETKNFCIVDAAMNDLPRPAMYQAYHHIVPAQQKSEQAAALYDVVGPVCESGDWIGRDRELAVQAGDTLAVLSVGAYSMSMASNYNTRARALEVLVDGDAVTVIRRRERFDDLIAQEV